MRLLVTTSRMPCAVEEIRKLGRAGHEVHTADTFREAPGNHSRYAGERWVVPSPRHATAGFIAEIGEIARANAIELVLPMFEEVFYLQRYARDLGPGVNVFAPTFEVLHQLHDKREFVALATELGIAVPRTTVVETTAELVQAISEIPRYFARPTYSRGGVFLCTNTGPLAGVLPPLSCRVTAANPWLVQEFVSGVDVCTFSIAHHGRVAAHSTYVHPKTIDSAGGIVFESVVDPEALAIVQRFVEATSYHGQVSFDFLRTDHGLVAVECNPRPTAGASVMPDEMFVQALLHPSDGPPRVAPAGTRRHIWSALLRDMIYHWREIPSDFREIFSGAEDVYATHDDPWPGVWQFLSLAHVRRYRKALDADEHTRSDLMSAYFADVSWDGESGEVPPRVARLQHPATSREAQA